MTPQELEGWTGPVLGAVAATALSVVLIAAALYAAVYLVSEALKIVGRWLP